MRIITPSHLHREAAATALDDLPHDRRVKVRDVDAEERAHDQGQRMDVEDVRLAALPAWKHDLEISVCEGV